MTKRLLQLASVLLFAGLVLGAVEAKKKPIVVGDYFVYQKTEDGKVEVLFEEAFEKLMKKRFAKK
jgi:hypothetical protein